MTYDENRNPMTEQQEDAWLDDLKAFLDEDPSDTPKPVSDLPNPFEMKMSDVFREFGTDVPEQEAAAPAACATMEPRPRRQEKSAKEKTVKESNPSHAVLFLIILVILEAAAIIAVAASWLLWMK